jgi:hypothetical protein
VMVPLIIITVILLYILLGSIWYYVGFFVIIGIIALLVLISIVLTIGFILFVTSISMSWNVFLARMIERVGEKGSISFSGAFSELWREKRSYLSRGLGMSCFLIVVILPITLVLFAIPYSLIYLAAYSVGLQDIILFPLVIQLVSYIISLPITPITSFIAENGSVHVARGKSGWGGMFASISDIFRRPRFFGTYYLGLLVLSIAMLVLFPIAMIAGAFIPIATKTFLIVNDDL